MANSNQTQLIVFGLAAAVSISLAFYFMSRGATSPYSGGKGKGSRDDDELDDMTASTKDSASTARPSAAATPSTPKPGRNAQQPTTADADKTPLVKNTKSEGKEVHARIEDLDKKGKDLFKEKQVRLFSVGGSY